ncbi:MAG: efflux RND transporter periplasmic adaptor subunit [Opitutaceae bacterium]
MNVTATAELPVVADRSEELAAIVSAPLRADLVLQRQLFRGNEYYVIKDPLALTYFRLQHEEGYLITLLDGKRTLGDVHRLMLAHFPNKELTLEEIAAFMNQMSTAGLLNINARRFVSVARAQQSVPKGWLMMWGRLLSGLLFMRFPLFDPSPWLGKLTHAIRFLWSRWFVALCSAFITWTIFWLIVNREAFTQNTINFFSTENLFLVWVTIIIVKTLHEFGHATTCRHFGGEVHEMGICLICFAPAGYVDASDAWMMRNKAHKLYTTMAGVFTEFVIAGIAAHLWLYLPPGLAKNLAFNAMIVASVNTVFFNANPLMKFDGYYVVSDLLEIPNLRSKAMVYCSYHLQRWLLGYRNIAQERALQDERHNRVFVVYSVLAYLYMMTVIYSLTQVFARFLGPYGLHDFGLALGIFVEGSFVMFPVVKVLSDAFTAKRANMVREENVWLRIARWFVPLVVGLFLLSWVPSHFKISQQAVFVAANSDRAGLEVGGVVERVHVRSGDWVEAQAPLLTLRNADVTTDAKLADLNLEAAMTRMMMVQGSAARRAEGREGHTGFEAEKAARERARLAESKLVVRAPSAGFVAATDIERLEGQYLPPGFSGIRIADLRHFKLTIPLTEGEAQLVEVGSRVKGYTRAQAVAVEGKITVLPTKKASWPDDYQAAMLSIFGGPAPLEMTSANERMSPAFGLYLAEAEVLQPPPDTMEGSRVKVTITGRKATYGQRAWRWMVGLWRARTAM